MSDNRGRDPIEERDAEIATLRTEQAEARAEVERLRGSVDRARHSARRAGLRATSAESALTEARERCERAQSARLERERGPMTANDRDAARGATERDERGEVEYLRRAHWEMTQEAAQAKAERDEMFSAALRLKRKHIESHARAEAAEAALTSEREAHAGLRARLEALADECEEKVKDRRLRRDHAPRGFGISINQERDRAEWQGELRAYNHAAGSIRTLAAEPAAPVAAEEGGEHEACARRVESGRIHYACGVTVAVGTPDAYAAHVSQWREQEAGETEPPPSECYCPDDHASWCPNLIPAPSGSDDTKGGAA